jgi:ankyrin repeat protein
MRVKNVNAQLLDAYRADDETRMRAALDRGANPNIRMARSVMEDRILFDTVTNDHANAFRLLIDRGACIVDRPKRYNVVLLCVFHKRCVMLDYLFDKFDIAALDASVRTSNRPVLQAVSRRDKPMVRYLVDKGCDVNGRNHASSGHTPFSYAVREGDFEMASLLLELGADPHKRGLSDLLPIEHAEYLTDSIEDQMVDLIRRHISHLRAGR